MLGGYCPLILLVTILFQSSCWRVSTKQKYHLSEEERRLSPGLFSKTIHQRYGLNQASIRLPNKSRGKYWSYPPITDKPESKYLKTFHFSGMKRNSELLTVLYSLPEDMRKMLRNGR